MMTMNWHQRRHCFPCPACGALLEVGDYNCDSEECEAEQRRELLYYRRRDLIWAYRQGYIHGGPRRDEEEFRSTHSVIGFGRYIARRHVGGKLTYRQIVPPTAEYPKELAFRVDWWRVPHSVVSQAHRYFKENRT